MSPEAPQLAETQEIIPGEVHRYIAGIIERFRREKIDEPEVQERRRAITGEAAEIAKREMTVGASCYEVTEAHVDRALVSLGWTAKTIESPEARHELVALQNAFVSSLGTYSAKIAADRQGLILHENRVVILREDILAAAERIAQEIAAAGEAVRQLELGTRNS